MGRISVSLGFLSLLCLLLWLDWDLGLWFALGIFLHELGHLLAMVLCRVPVSGISVRLSGAVIAAHFPSYGKELVCALAGPAASLLTAVLTRQTSPQFGVVNGLLAAVNLLPLYPLDGGRILRVALHLCCGAEKTGQVMRAVTYTVCGTLMLLACWLTAARQAGIWPIFAALVLLCRVGKASLAE